MKNTTEPQALLAVDVRALDRICGGTRLTAMLKGAAAGAALVSPYIAWSNDDSQSKLLAGTMGLSWGSVAGLATRWAFKGTKGSPWRPHLPRGLR